MKASLDLALLSAVRMYPIASPIAVRCFVRLLCEEFLSKLRFNACAALSGRWCLSYGASPSKAAFSERSPLWR
ncbi:hypothetical protein HPP92_018742 [Vanilla planifolia]|uniref:Uncharacterized protein n=1 Tax=Vanilla planifolia TaxID=51239 RepID=A0A835QDG7_VANPL|nr:hypothetical protein HPP92_018742 [Vanilla planifolia]